MTNFRTPYAAALLPRSWTITGPGRRGDKHYGLWRVAEDDTDSYLCESWDANVAIEYMQAHS